MKRSTAVVLVLSGAILSGCSRREEQTGFRDTQVVTNGTYVEGRGYYHAPFHTWYPFPYNFFAPGLGYFRGGSYFTQPDLTQPRPTVPGRSQATASRENVNRGGFTRNRSGGTWSAGS